MMPVGNATKMQEEFVECLSKSSEELATAWSQAIKSVGVQNVYESYEKLMRNWVNPSAFMRILDSTSTAVKIQEFIRIATDDLPDLLKHTGDQEKVKQIKDKWMQSYESLVREMFGIPAVNDIERVMQSWKSLLGGSAGSGPGLFPPFGGVPASLGWPFAEAASAGRGLFPLWSETYERTISKIFGFPGFGLTREFEERTKKALDAQIRFLNTLPDFHEQVLTASKAAMDKVVDQITKMGIKEVSPETCQLFYKIWISNNEDAFIDLFRSESFCNTLANTIHRGMEAKKKMDAVMADGLSFWNIPSGKDMNEVYQTVYQMQKRIRQLERELAELKGQSERRPRTEVAS